MLIVNSIEKASVISPFFSYQMVDSFTYSGIKVEFMNFTISSLKATEILCEVTVSCSS